MKQRFHWLMDWLGSTILDLWVWEGTTSDSLMNQSQCLMIKLCYLVGCKNNNTYCVIFLLCKIYLSCETYILVWWICFETHQRVHLIKVTNIWNEIQKIECVTEVNHFDRNSCLDKFIKVRVEFKGAPEQGYFEF